MFQYTEIAKKNCNPSFSKIVYPMIKIKVDCNIPKKLESAMHKRAWLKYILDNNDIKSYNKLCGRCMTSLLDSDDYCPLCNTPIRSIIESDIYYIRVYNDYRFVDICIDSNDDIMKNLYINSRLLYTFTNSYLDVVLYMKGIIIKYPTRYDFPEYPDSDDIYNILLDESTKTLYIVDYGSKLINKSTEIVYKEVGTDNIKYVLDIMNKHAS